MKTQDLAGRGVRVVVILFINVSVEVKKNEGFLIFARPWSKGKMCAVGQTDVKAR